MPTHAPYVTGMRQAELLLDNASGFLDGARRSGSTHVAAYQMTVALELLLKSRLSLAGVPDRVCAAMGHDLRLSAALTRGLGMSIPPEIDRLLPDLCPYFRNGGFHRLPARRWSPTLLRGAMSAMSGLVASTMAMTRRGRRRYLAAVEALPSPQRDIFRRATGDESIASIARNLGRSPEAVEMLLADALVRIDDAMR